MLCVTAALAVSAGAGAVRCAAELLFQAAVACIFAMALAPAAARSFGAASLAGAAAAAAAGCCYSNSSTLPLLRH